MNGNNIPPPGATDENISANCQNKLLNPVLELSLCKKAKRYFLDAAATCALCWLFLLGKQSAAFHTNVSLRAKYII